MTCFFLTWSVASQTEAAIIDFSLGFSLAPLHFGIGGVGVGVLASFGLWQLSLSLSHSLSLTLFLLKDGVVVFEEVVKI